jgi:hypothetical protein
VAGATVGATLSDILNGAQPGNFGWLTWAGSPSVPTLVASLMPPGDSATYVNPDNTLDHQVSVGDWVQGKPGVSNSQNVRDALEALKAVDITVPVWDQTRSRGNQTDYRVSAFAHVRLLGYVLPGQNRVTAQFLGFVTCDAQNTAPVVNAGGDRTVDLPAELTLNGSVTDDGLPNGTLAIAWTQDSGPGSATFSAPDQATTTVSFDAPGAYVLRLSARAGSMVAGQRRHAGMGARERFRPPRRGRLHQRPGLPRLLLQRHDPSRQGLRA